MAKASGYCMAEPEALASLGGFKDWFIDYFHRPAFTIEAGKGKNPLPYSQLTAIESCLFPLMVEGLLAGAELRC